MKAGTQAGRKVTKILGRRARLGCGCAGLLEGFEVLGAVGVCVCVCVCVYVCFTHIYTYIYDFV